MLIERRDVVEPPGRSHQEQLVLGGAHVRMAQVPAGVHADRCSHVGQSDARGLVAGRVHGRDRTGRLHEGLQPGRGLPGRGELGQHRLTGRQLVVGGRGARRRLDTAIDPVDDLVQQGPEHRPVVHGVEAVPTLPSQRGKLEQLGQVPDRVLGAGHQVHPHVGVLVAVHEGRIAPPVLVGAVHRHDLGGRAARARSAP